MKSLLIGSLSALLMPLTSATPPMVNGEPQIIVLDEPPVVAPDVSPWDKDDGDWITIPGKVVEAGVNTFKLDYGKGAIIVEIDDYDRALEGFNIKVDDKVIVTGRVDADKDQKRSIEAASVYIEGIKKTFFASADDKEEVIAKLRATSMNGTALALTGKVIIQADDLITVDTGYQVFDVNTAPIKKDRPMLKVGDKVTAYGAITDGFVNSRTFAATRIIKR